MVIDIWRVSKPRGIQRLCIEIYVIMHGLSYMLCEVLFTKDQFH